MTSLERKSKAEPGGLSWPAVTLWLASLYGKPWWRRLALGVAVALAGALLRPLIFPSSVGYRLAYVTFYPAVQLAALLGGWVSGVSAVLLSGLLSHLLFVPLTDFGDWLGLAIFLAAGVAVSGVSEALRSELAKGKARLDAIIDATKDAVLTTDEAGVIQLMNLAGAQMFGYAQEEVVGQTLRFLMPERYRGQREPGPGIVSGEGEARRKDGSRFPIEAAVAEASHDRDSARLFVVCVRDLSDQRRAEARIEKLHEERLTATETITAALAHELNQPLAATATYLNVIRRLLRLPAEARRANVEDTLDRAIAQIGRAGHIIADLRNFIARGEPDKTAQSLHELIKEVYGVVLPEAKPPISGGLELNAADDRVLIDRVQMGLVLTNLLRNALEAMKGCERRRLSVSTSNVGEKIRVEIADTGSGVPAAVKDGLFETFASTKKTGMGAGLMISKSIIDAHYGKMAFEPNPGGGAIFSFALPLFEG